MQFHIYNSLTRQKEIFEPLHAPFVGLYVCGPTVYGEPHLGHARPAITYDILVRYLRHLNYKVRYIRNITDVGHLENDEAETGEDKIAKKARLEQLEPMEIVQHYTNKYHEFIARLNVEPPSIEPQASGHIIEQLSFIQKILDKGSAYISNGSVYFDIEKYNESHQYGILSGRKIEDMQSNTRELEGQQEKRNPLDFALWKKASTNHIMRWPSPWSEGFPGWHLECSAMSAKYLGEQFDIHGGGMDLLFPHHECEIAQSSVAHGKIHAKYWMHNNMITINGKKMGKSLGNFITLSEFYSGKHNLLEKSYEPETIRFFVLQAHYRSTLDFSNDALQAAEKGLERIKNAIQLLEKIKPSDNSNIDVAGHKKNCFQVLNDDLNTPLLLAELFELVKVINLAYEQKISLTAENLVQIKELFVLFGEEILGLNLFSVSKIKTNKTDELAELLLQIRMEAKQNKDFQTADKIRDEMMKIGIEVKDRKDGYEWKWR